MTNLISFYTDFIFKLALFSYTLKNPLISYFLWPFNLLQFSPTPYFKVPQFSSLRHTEKSSKYNIWLFLPEFSVKLADSAEGWVWVCTRERIHACARGASLKLLRGVTKILNCYLCALRLGFCSKMFETLASSTLFYFVKEKALVLVVYPLPMTEVRTLICWPLELSSHGCWLYLGFMVPEVRGYSAY